MPPQVIAHRGDSAHRPENTLAAFLGALEQGAEFIELDVHLTRDGEVVVLHDPTLDRTTTGRGAVAALTSAEIRRLSAGYPARFGGAYAAERVPTLREVLALVKGRARVMVEMKPEGVKEDEAASIEAPTIGIIREAGMEKDVALISFARRALERCRDRAPEILRGHLFHRAEAGEMLAGVRAAAAEICMPEKSLLTTELRDLCREAGVKLASWVVDDPGELRALERFELYGVGSNRPGALLEALRLSPPAGG